MNEHEPEPRAPVLAFPGWPLFLYGAWLQLAVGAFWFLAFGASDWASQLNPLRVHVHFAFEPALPLWPALTLAYVSLYPLCWLAPLIVRERRGLDALASCVVAETVLACVVFVLLPVESGFAPIDATQLGNWGPLFRFADALNLDFNMLPSLHVAYAVTFAGVYARNGARALFWSWAALIALSTVLTHQHHLADVAAGAGLGAGAVWGYARLIRN
jgi:membrane-associated phospholipid phosphatase